MTRPVAVLLAVVVSAAAAGCGDKKVQPIVGVPHSTNDSPRGALSRFESTFENEDLVGYSSLFTSDFSFRFSTDWDAALAASFGTTWGVARESLSAHHLFSGIPPEDLKQPAFEGAKAIRLTMADFTFAPDTTHADSASHYRWARVATVTLEVTFPGGEDSPYVANFPQEFYVVRGDAAVLRAGQPADSLHWYIRRWDDKASFGFGATAPATADIRPTWGQLKAYFL